MSRISTTKIGEIEVISLTDGATEFGAELFPGTEASEIEGLLKEAGKDAIETNFNAFLIKSGGNTMLVDAGPRDLFGPTCGFLMDALAEAGTAPEDISHLLFTHLHPDHVAGALTPDGEAVFERAQVIVSEPEAQFWMNETFTDDTLNQWQQVAQGVLGAYAGRVEQVAATAEVMAGVTLLDLPGHTPGHVGFRVDDGSDSFAHGGDIAHAQTLQLANPEISIVFDIDADTARATRKKTLDMVATDGMQFSGGHMLRPTLGRLERAGGGYRFVTE